MTDRYKNRRRRLWLRVRHILANPYVWKLLVLILRLISKLNA